MSTIIQFIMTVVGALTKAAMEAYLSKQMDQQTMLQKISQILKDSADEAEKMKTTIGLDDTQVLAALEAARVRVGAP